MGPIHDAGGQLLHSSASGQLQGDPMPRGLPGTSARPPQRRLGSPSSPLDRGAGALGTSAPGRPSSRCRRACTAASGADPPGPWSQLLGLAAPRRLLPRSDAQPGAGRQLLQLAQEEGSGASGGGPPPPNMDVSEVYENQRSYGVGWKAPLSVLDWPEWSDETGRPVALPSSPAADPGWELVVGAATDDEGWQYGTVFKHLEYRRDGGRASSRFGDTVRRRLWRRRPDAGPGSPPAAALPAPRAAAAQAAAAASPAAASAVAAAAAARAAREAEAKKKAVKQFLSMVLDVLSRRPVWSLVPWDPAAPFLLYQKHQLVFQELQQQAHERRLFTADQPAPPSQLREGRTLLQDLLCAALHSRAAYGYPAAIGGLSSVGDYLRLHTLQPLTFDAVGGASAEANTESLAALAGIAVEDVVMAEWRNTPFRPCHYVAIDRANQCLVLSVRGSLQVGDLLSDLAAAPMEVEVGGADGWVHQGIFAAATFIHCNTRAALEQAAARCPGWPLLVAGHSLGGGVAALVALLLQQGGLPQGIGPMRCITMGTAAVMSAPLARRCEGLVTSVIVGSDVVPHLSLASVEALLLEASEASPLRRTVTEWRDRLAGALSMGAAKQAELTEAATAAASAAATGGAKIAGSWAAVRQASAALGRNASGAGLARILSAARQQEGKAGGGSEATRQIPVLVQQPAPLQSPPWQQQLQRQAPQPIPVIDLAAQQATPQPAAAGSAPQQAADGGGGSSAGMLSQLLPAGDAVGLEGFFAEERQQGGAPTPPPAAQQEQQQQQEQQEQLLPYFCEFDSPLAESAVAQEAAADRAAAAAAQPAPSAAGDADNGGSGPGNPELLFPPGRIIWIFPADEDVAAVQAEAEQQLQAMDASWQGGTSSPPPTPTQSQQQQAADQQQQQQQQAAGGVTRQAVGGSARGQYELTNADPAVQGRGSVDMEEAVEAVEEGAAGGGASGGAEAGAGAGQSRRECVAVDADRASFERLLILPEMLNDHLPDRYLAALQQL